MTFDGMFVFFSALGPEKVFGYFGAGGHFHDSFYLLLGRSDRSLKGFFFTE
jgi:hypothetical protein